MVDNQLVVTFITIIEWEEQHTDTILLWMSAPHSENINSKYKTFTVLKKNFQTVIH
jgi:hypothetical protein